MALSSLTSLTQAQYNALQITPFSKAPGVSSTGNPDPRISIQLGGWVGTDVLAFTVTNQPITSSGLSVDARSANTLNANVNNGANPSSQTTYWTVNMGAGASGGNWQITYGVLDGTTSTGTWVFVKGKVTEDRKAPMATLMAAAKKAPVPKKKATPKKKKAPIAKKKAAPKKKKKAPVAKKKAAPKKKKAPVAKKKAAPKKKKAATKKKVAPKKKKAAASRKKATGKKAVKKGRKS